ncbi:MAG: hypothetical protein AAFS10_14410, partial [Myxococcota bacterium]
MKPNQIALTSASIVFGLLVAAVLSSAVAENSELDTGPRVIPYNGVLEFNGTAFNGDADLQFSITADDGASCTFVEEHDNVPVYSGRFGVNIGSVAGAGVDGCIFDAQEVTITIGVRGANESGEYVVLSGRQRIQPVPFSYWAAESSDIRVDGTALIT